MGGKCLDAVPAGLPSRGGVVTVYVLDINQASLPTLVASVSGGDVAQLVGSGTLLMQVRLPGAARVS